MSLYLWASLFFDNSFICVLPNNPNKKLVNYLIQNVFDHNSSVPFFFLGIRKKICFHINRERLRISKKSQGALIIILMYLISDMFPIVSKYPCH